MAEYVAFITDTDPLRVRLQYEDDDVRVTESVIKEDELSVDDRVLVSTDNHEVTIIGRYGGTSGGGHEEDTVEEDDTLSSVASHAGIKSITLEWDADDRVDAGHGYYEAHISEDSDFDPLSSRWTGKATKVTFDDLGVGTQYHYRVRPVGADGVPGEWVDGTATAQAAQGSDIADRAIDLIHLEDEALRDERVFYEDVIEGRFLKARTISTKQLLVGNFDNLIQNPIFQHGTEPHHIQSNAGGSWETFESGSPHSGDYVLMYVPPSGGLSGDTAEIHLNGDALDPDEGHVQAGEGDTFHARYHARASSGALDADIEARISFYDSDGNFLDDGASDSFTYDDSGFDWEQRSLVSDPAPSGTAYVVLRLRVTSTDDGDPSNDHGVQFDSLHLRERITGELIVDGSVSADKLAAGTVAVGEEIKSAGTDSNGDPLWVIDGDGNVEFNDGTFRGDIEGAQITGGRIIQEDDDSVATPRKLDMREGFFEMYYDGDLAGFIQPTESSVSGHGSSEAIAIQSADGIVQLLVRNDLVGVIGDFHVPFGGVEVGDHIAVSDNDGYTGDKSDDEGFYTEKGWASSFARDGSTVLYVNRQGSSGPTVTIRNNGNDEWSMYTDRIAPRGSNSGARIRMDSDGGSTSPAYAFGSHSDSGMYCLNSSGELRFTSKGNIGLRVGTDGNVEILKHITTRDSFGRFMFQSDGQLRFFAGSSYPGANDPAEALSIRDEVGSDNHTGLRSGATYARTTSASANVYITGSGNFSRESSSLRTKKDIESIDSESLELFKKVRPVWHRSKGKADEHRPHWSYYGAIAEEVHEAGLPQLVHYVHKDGPKRHAELEDAGEEIPEEDLVPDGVMYDRFGVFAVAWLQEADKRIEELEAKVQALTEKRE